MIVFKLLLLSLFLLISTPIYALEPIILTDNKDKYIIGHYVEVLEDENKEYTIEEVASGKFDKKFVKNNSDTPPSRLSCR